MSPGEFVDSCLDVMGPLEVDDRTRGQLVAHAAAEGDLSWGPNGASGASTDRVGEMLQLIVSLQAYQFA